jgi:hypothetical protein
LARLPQPEHRALLLEASDPNALLDAARDVATTDNSKWITAEDR